ncbi:DNA methyltransferase [Novilysobacter spongiicola]|nr:site-specific DNA-methyltransferase [Lysobacter spongiicola]
MTDTTPTKFTKLVTLLKELFQLDQPDLDFGIYRIMHAKAREVSQFLERDLLPQVKDAFAQYQSADGAELRKELAELEATLRRVKVDPDNNEEVQKLREQLKSAIDLGALENEVYDHLYSFFRRYYSEGDFLAKRVYKPGVYAIPYEGEEVTLHWANKDQYYIKTNEYLRDYAFRLKPEAGEGEDPMRVRFKLVDAAEGEHGNVKAAEGKDRMFVLAADDFIAEIAGELELRFEYRPATLEDWPADQRDGKKRPPAQKDLSASAVATILAAGNDLGSWLTELRKTHVMANGEQADYSRLEAHLRRYTGRNTFDYFIHKDLDGFLRRELDFYIKNEVMHLDDVESETAPRVEQYLSKIKVIRRVAGKIIDFVAQLENFQKKLWLKRKLVASTSYLVTIDKLPPVLIDEVLASKDQLQEWEKLYKISTWSDYKAPIGRDFLLANPGLCVDTELFSPDFQSRLLAEIETLDQDTLGILVHSDNFQALRLGAARFASQFKSIYIDPPYNTNSSSIPYKNDYKHSSFATFMRDRLEASHALIRDDGAIFVSIDKTERTVVEHALDSVFGADNHIEELIWTQATSNGQLPNYSTNHEYVEVYAKSRAAVESDKAMFREPKPGYSEVMELVAQLNDQFPPIDVVESALKQLYERHREEYRDEVIASGAEWDADAKRQDPWRGIYPYSRAEYRDADSRLVDENDAKALGGKLWVWSEIPTGAPASKQSPTTRDPNHANYRFYKPVHPITGQPCPHPQSGWKFPAGPIEGAGDRRSFQSLQDEDRIAWGEDENKVPRTKGFLHEVETNIGTSVFYEYNDGEAELTNMFGETGLFLSPKSSKFVKKFVLQTARSGDWFCDFFGGSGSSAHAVVQANREDRAGRKFLIVEVGNHFDTLTKPRTVKSLLSSDWKGGAPRSRDSVSAVMKVVRLETYEDALNNIELRQPAGQQALFTSSGGAQPGLREDYLLRYQLDVESRGSASLLDIKAFSDPTAYKMLVKRPGSDESRESNVDLLETFNWLLGLTVEHIAAPRSFAAKFERDDEDRLRVNGRLKQDADGPWWFRTVTGTTPEGRKTLVIWRKLTGDAEQDNLVLETWFRDKQLFSVRDTEFDVIYVNGDNTLENIRLEDESWKVRLTEEDFQRLMFEGTD